MMFRRKLIKTTTKTPEKSQDKEKFRSAKFRLMKTGFSMNTNKHYDCSKII